MQLIVSPRPPEMLKSYASSNCTVTRQKPAAFRLFTHAEINVNPHIHTKGFSPQRNKTRHFRGIDLPVLTQTCGPSSHYH